MVLRLFVKFMPSNLYIANFHFQGVHMPVNRETVGHRLIVSILTLLFLYILCYAQTQIKDLSTGVTG